MTSTPEPRREQQQIAVWYFVGATFAFVAPTLFFPDVPAWARIGCIVVGVVAFVAGAVQFRRERRQRRSADAAAHGQRPS